MVTEELTAVYIVASIILFIVGTTAGWYAANRAENITREHLRLVVAIVITMVWVITITAEIFIPTYTVSVLIHSIMGGVVGYLFSEDGINLNIRSKK